MGWLDWWFSSTSPHSRRGQALSSTHEAFSLPTSSPTQPHPDAFNPEMFANSDLPNSPSGRYTYPPQSASSYSSYGPTLNTSRSRHASLLPLHSSPLPSPSIPRDYPPLAQTWNRLRTWLAREYPELGDTLNYGILPLDLAEIEMQFGFELPAVIRESYLVVDGQEAESSAGCPEGLFFGLTFLPLDDVLEEWRFWREVDQDPSTGANPDLREMMQSLPPGWIRREYSQRGWIPLITDKGGNYIGVDMNPGTEGSVGQVIVFGRDFDTKVVMWKGDGHAGWAKWLASFVEELEGGEGYEIGQSNEQSEGSEDGVGYEGYFHDGTGRGQGDGAGDSGSGGGLRFTGEYRGWSPMEAWADRSVRKWYEAGAIPDQSPVEQSESGKSTEPIGLGVLDLSSQGAAEVPIPVLTEESKEQLQEPYTPKPPLIHSPDSMPIPTISITKPPAPLPVELPTPHDIDTPPSPPESTTSSYADDLETGRSPSMREVPRDRITARRSSHSTTSVKPIASTDVELVDISPDVTAPDLLTDAAPALETAAIEPSKAIEVSGTNVEESSPDPEATTIRLVGGGGITGSASTPPISDVVDGEEPSSSDVPETDSKGKQDKKNNLTAGLKKIGNIGVGGKRKNLRNPTEDVAL